MKQERAKSVNVNKARSRTDSKGIETEFHVSWIIKLDEYDNIHGIALLLMGKHYNAIRFLLIEFNLKRIL